MNRLQEKYKNVVVPQMMKDFEYKSVMEVPHVEKVVINIGVGDAITNAKLLDEAVEELTAITGQAPVVTKAKKSIANFKLREGMPIGCKVTLRKEKMYEFLDKLFNISLPRVRDFRGVNPDAFDGRGNQVCQQAVGCSKKQVGSYQRRFVSQHEICRKSLHCAVGNQQTVECFCFFSEENLGK